LSSVKEVKSCNLAVLYQIIKQTTNPQSRFMSHTEHTQQKKPKKKFHSRFTKYLYERDTIFATLWVFIFIVGLGAIPLNLGFLNPIKLGLKDFDYNDISYSKLDKGGHTPLDKRIVIVNIGNADRELLSLMIDKAGEMKPKVMALDALFFQEKDPLKDSMLNMTFSKHKNLVAAAKLELSGKDGDTINISGDYFKTASSYAYVNFFNEETSTTRYYEPFLKDHNGKSFPSFTSTIIEKYDTIGFNKIKSKAGQKVLINYERRTQQYQIIEHESLLDNQVDPSALTGKIVLFGYINLDKNDISDKKFTPMNEKFAGKSIPDMNGIVVHANIISMILDNNYVKKVPSWVNLLIAIAVCWLFMSFFIHYYLESHIWFHLVAKIAQVSALILFTYLGIFLYDQYRLKVDMKMSLIVIIMAVDVIYFYEAWAQWMHKKFGYQTVFKPHHH
jgi:CHASE2 domain-containing sensor protein